MNQILTFNSVVKGDIIKITDEDILNAMAFTLYGKTYKDVINLIDKEFSDLLDTLIKLTSSPNIKYKILSFDSDKDQYNYHLRVLCIVLSNFRASMYITDLFLVSEIYMDHFKVGLLNEYDRKHFERVGKLKEIIMFLESLKFPYEWEYTKFFRMGHSL